MKSALAASAANPGRIYGFHQSQVRERLAALFYSHKTMAQAAHIVDRNMELAAACGGTGARHAQPRLSASPRPRRRRTAGRRFRAGLAARRLEVQAVAARPLPHSAARLRRELGIPLVLDGPPGASFADAEPAIPHHSSLAGLIYATRRAAAVVGVDSGPASPCGRARQTRRRHLRTYRPRAQRPLRRVASRTAHFRRRHHLQARRVIDPSMQQISPDQVFELLRAMLHERRHPAGSMAE